jgi:D-galactose 1-dehydrogenase
VSARGEAGPLGLGIAGFGKIARDQHIPAISAMADMRLCAVADSLDRHPDLPSYPCIAAMIEGERDLDAVVLCQPPPISGRGGSRGDSCRQARLS